MEGNQNEVAGAQASRQPPPKQESQGLAPHLFRFVLAFCYQSIRQAIKIISSTNARGIGTTARYRSSASLVLFLPPPILTRRGRRLCCNSKRPRRGRWHHQTHRLQQEEWQADRSGCGHCSFHGVLWMDGLRLLCAHVVWSWPCLVWSVGVRCRTRPAPHIHTLTATLTFPAFDAIARLLPRRNSTTTKQQPGAEHLPSAGL